MRHIDTMLLLALPASGKSEIRRYLFHLDPEIRRRELGIGDIVELDDYPYVRLMILIDLELVDLGAEPIFFDAPGGLFRDGRDWGTLAGLLAEDYGRLGGEMTRSPHPLQTFLARFDAARTPTGAGPVSAQLPRSLFPQIERAIDPEYADLEKLLVEAASRYDESSTVIVEFARGGPEGSDMPLPPPHGYRYTLPFLGTDMLERASILYVWATPEESRRRNLERAHPGGEADATVLHHSAPDVVMRNDYGTDDLPWLIDQGGGAVHVDVQSRSIALPAATIDNRVDATSFLRDDPSTWDEGAVRDLHRRLTEAITPLA